MLTQKGSVAIILAIIVVVGAGSAAVFNQKLLFNTFVEHLPISEPTPTPRVLTLPTPMLSPTNTPSIFDRFRGQAQPLPTAKVVPNTPTLPPLVTATPTPKPTVTSTPPTATPTPTPSVVCEVHYSGQSGTYPIPLSFYYGASFYNSSGYVTDVRWDFDGNGTWDTPYDTANQHITHEYSQAGIYNVKMQLQTSDNLTSNVCSLTIVLY